MIAFEHTYKFLLFLHLAATFILIGAMTHNIRQIINYTRGVFTGKHKEKTFITVSFYAYLIVFLFGMIIYPAFRVHVRAEYLDQFAPWATGLFEVKEHWATICLALLGGLSFFRRKWEPDMDKEKIPFYSILFFISYIVIIYLVIVGYWLTTIKAA